MVVGLLCSLTLVDAKVNIGVARLDSMITELFVAKFAFSSSAHGVISVSPAGALWQGGGSCCGGGVVACSVTRYGVCVSVRSDIFLAVGH